MEISWKHLKSPNTETTSSKKWPFSLFWPTLLHDHAASRQVKKITLVCCSFKCRAPSGMKKSASIPVQLTVTSQTSKQLPKSLRPTCCHRFTRDSGSSGGANPQHDQNCEMLLGLRRARWNSSTSVNSVSAQSHHSNTTSRPSSRASANSER